METNKMRCHFSIIFEKAGSFLVFWFLLALNFIDDIVEIFAAPDFSPDALKEVLPFCLGMTLVLLIIVGYQFLIWRKTYIYLENDIFVVERNTLNRKKTTFSISSIANLNLEQNLFERIVGTYRLKLDTDSLSTANSTDVSIVLSGEKANALKSQLMTLMKKDTTPEVAQTQEEEGLPFASAKEVVSHCFFSISTPLLSMALAIIIGIPLFIYFSNSSLWEVLAEDDPDFGGGSIAVILLAATYIYSIVKQLFSFYHFSCFRRKNDLIIRYGFLKKQDFTIPVSHINAIKIIQPPLARLFGRMQAQLVCVGVGDSEAEKPQLTLCMKKKDFYARLQELLPEFSTEEMQSVHKLPKGSGPSYLLSGLFTLSCFSAGFWIAALALADNPTARISWTIIYSTIAVLFVLYRLFHYFSMGTQLLDEQLLIQNGAYQKQTWLIPYKKIQYIDFRHNPVYRRFHIMKGNVFILASFGNNTMPLPFIHREDMKTLQKELLG